MECCLGKSGANNTQIIETTSYANVKNLKKLKSFASSVSIVIGANSFKGLKKFNFSESAKSVRKL